MAECAAGVAVLGTLLLGTITVVGLQEVQRRGIVGAREAAFQGIWMGRNQDAMALQQQLAREYFDDAGLTNTTGTDRLLKPADVDVTSSQGRAPGRGAAAVEFLLTPLRAAGGFLGWGFDLSDSGFQTGMVSATLQDMSNLPAPFQTLQLRFDQPFALLGNDWSSSGPPHVARRAAGLVPSHLLVPLSRIWRPLSAPLSIFEPSLGELCFGLLEPDRVPEDRLGPGRLQGLPTCP